MKLGSKIFLVIHFVVGVAGMVLISQGVSFSRWNEFRKIGDSINDHANLLIVCGVGFVALEAFVWHICRRISLLEERVQKIEQKQAS